MCPETHMPELPCPTCGLDQRQPVSAVPPEAVDAATAVFLRGGTVRDMLEAAAPWMAAASPGEDAPGSRTGSPQTAEQAPAHTSGTPRP
jgi:hypothetical protein